VSVAVGTRSDEPGPRFLALMACGASALDDRRRQVGDKLPVAVLAHPDRKIAIVNVHDRASHRDPGGSRPRPGKNAWQF